MSIPDQEHIKRLQGRVAGLASTVNRLRGQLARQRSMKPAWLGAELRRQRLDIASDEGQAFVAGWVNGDATRPLQVPLLIEDRLRAFYIAGYMARKDE